MKPNSHDSDSVIPEEVVIRLSRALDADALETLRQLDSAETPPAPVIVAEVRGKIVAARSLANGIVIADPFRPTADLVAMLEARATRLRPSVRARRRLAARWRRQYPEPEPA